MHPKTEIPILERQVFIHDTSEFDKRFFKQGMVDFLKNNEGKTFHNYIFWLVWVRNEKGTTAKYCWYNPRAGKVYLERRFWKWVELMFEEIKEAQTKMQVNG